MSITRESRRGRRNRRNEASSEPLKDRAFGILQRVGRSFMLPIAILPAAGLLLGLGSSFTNATAIATYHLEWLLGDSTPLHALLVIMNEVGSVIFDNLPLIFAVGTAIGMAKKEKEVAALSAVIAFFVMHISINALLRLSGQVLTDGTTMASVMEGTIADVCGIQTLQMGVFGGIIVGIGVAALHNRFYKIEFPPALSFFGGSRFVPIISTIVYMFVGILMYFVWPFVQSVIYALGSLVTGTGYIGTLFFGIIKRALIPFGLHHVFYMPFWQTAVGGSMEVAGKLVQGGQNIFFAQLADAANVTHFSADATRYFSGEFIFMIFGLPGAALAMYRCAKPERKKQAGGLLISAALTCMLTGITEPLEFSFLFVAPLLFVVQVILAGSAYMVAHILNIAVGLTFSGGLLDLFLFGILQGNQKTSWLLIIPAGIVYFLLYYFIFYYLIRKFDLKTPGREDEQDETKLYTKSDMNAKANEKLNGNRRAQSLSEQKLSQNKDQNGNQNKDFEQSQNQAKNQGANQTVNKTKTLSQKIIEGLGGAANLIDVDCCATRLRVSVKDSGKVNSELLKSTGASGVIQRGNGVQVIYGPRVSVIKSDLEEYLETASDQENTEVPESEVTQMPEQEQLTLDGSTSDAAHTQVSQNQMPPVAIASPLAGTVMELSEVPDEAFAEKLMGDGAAILPESDVVCAPDDATIAFVFDTGHAIGFETKDGLNILVHVGIDTVSLNGKGFTVLVTQGQSVKKGEPCIKLDLKYLRSHAPSLVTPVIVTEPDAGTKIHICHTGHILAGEDLFSVEKEN